MYMFLGALLTRRVGFQPLFLAFGWIVVEYGFLLAGIRHRLLGNVQETGDVVHLVGDSCGYLFVAFLIVFVNAELLRIISGICFRIIAREFVRYLLCDNAPIVTDVPRFNSLITTESHRPRAPPFIRSAYLWK